MIRKIIVRLLLASLFAPMALLAQTADLYKTDGYNGSLHQLNVGRITFMNGNIPLERYTESDFLKTFELAPRSDLNIRVFMDNSVANYLHRLEPSLTTQNVLQAGNLQFSFYVDGKPVYTENIHHGCGFGSGGNKNTSTTFRVPFTSTKGEDWWAMYMWDRFMLNGGEKALGEGTHKLMIEIRPYVLLPGKTGVKTGSLIARGELELVIKPVVIAPAQVAVQPIAPGSGWPVDTTRLNREKIEQLNTAIAKNSLKDITSVVAVYDGRLLLEEYFNGAARDTLHDTRSAGKSFTSTLMGIAIQEGYIKDEDQPLHMFYNLKQFANYTPEKDSVALRQLLTMSSGFSGDDADAGSPGNEENMYPAENWVNFTLSLPMDSIKAHLPRWRYFTAGVVLLGDILHKSVPGGLEQYADDKLFRPLGITHYKWQYTPQKVANTAGSLQMRSLDYARYAQLYKNNGVWNGTQVLPAEWVNKTLAPHMAITGRENQFYGYLFWNKTYTYNGREYEVWYCAGNGGNQFLIFKNLPLVVVITSKAYNKPYAHPQADKIVLEYLLPAIVDGSR